MITDFSGLYFDDDVDPSFEVLGVWEECPDYEGNLYAVLRKDGALYEMESSHCSCYGYDFSPGPVTAEYLRGRPIPYAVQRNDESVVEFQLLVGGL
jgi:hypothetical protein